MLALCCCGLDFSLEAKDFVESTCSLHMNLISKHVVSSSDRAGMSPEDVDLFGGLQGAEKLQKYYSMCLQLVSVYLCASNHMKRFSRQGMSTIRGAKGSSP